MGEAEGFFKHVGVIPTFLVLTLAGGFCLLIAPHLPDLQPLNLLVASSRGWFWLGTILSFTFWIVMVVQKYAMTRRTAHKLTAQSVPAVVEIRKTSKAVLRDGDRNRLEVSRFVHLTPNQKAILAFYFGKGNRYALHWLHSAHPDVEILARLGHIKRSDTNGSLMTGYGYTIDDDTYEYFQRNFSELDNIEVQQAFETLGQRSNSPYGKPYSYYP